MIATEVPGAEEGRFFFDQLPPGGDQLGRDVRGAGAVGGDVQKIGGQRCRG